MHLWGSLSVAYLFLKGLVAISAIVGSRMMDMEGFLALGDSWCFLGVWVLVAVLLASSPVAYIAARPSGLSLCHRFQRKWIGSRD